MKFKLWVNQITGKLTIDAYCLKCNSPTRKIRKGSKIGKQLGEDGWYCHRCRFFFIERNGVMYYCRVKNNPLLDRYERLGNEHLAMFVKPSKLGR